MNIEVKKGNLNEKLSKNWSQHNKSRPLLKCFFHRRTPFWLPHVQFNSLVIFIESLILFSNINFLSLSLLIKKMCE